MQAACQNCGTVHVLKDLDLGRHEKVQFRCSKCEHTTVVDLNRTIDSTMVISPLPSFARGDASSSNAKLPPLADGIRLPPTANVVLSLLSGPGKGKSYTLKKARVILGRADADVPLDDPEISRHHCLLEVRESFINLKDMDSTNGTFYEEERVRAAMLINGSEFRIGESLIRVNFVPK